MTVKDLILPLFLVALSAGAEESSADGRLSASSDPAAIMRANPYRLNLQDALTQKPRSSAIKLANTDFVIGGPIIENFRPHRYTPDRPALWKRIVLLPVKLVTPQPMPEPPGGGQYFKCKEENLQPSGDALDIDAGNAVNPIKQEPKGTAISVEK